MTNLRRLPALIGVASTVAAIAAVTFEGRTELIRPRVESIVVRPDTVWFCALQPDSHRVAYGFARTSRQWTTDAATRLCQAPPPPPAMWWHDTLPIPLAAGVRVERVMAATDSEGVRHGRSYLRYVDSARGLRLDLRPSFTPERVTALIAVFGGNVDEDTTAIHIGGSTVNDSLAWIGLAGGFPEGEGSFAGIYRIDRRTGEWRFIIDDSLSWNAVTGIAQTRDWLWVGTEQFAEYGPFGRMGLLRIDPRTLARRSYTDVNSPLPDLKVVDVEADDGVVAIATEKGIAVAELGGGSSSDVARWNVQYFVPGFAGDSLVFRLGEKAHAPTDSGEAYWIFVQSVAPRGRERPLFESLRAVPQRVVSEANDGHVVSDAALANPAYAPILVAMLQSHDEAKRTAARAITRMGRRTPALARSAARSAFLGLDSVNRNHGNTSMTWQELGIALRATGDSTAIRWARRTLDPGPGIGPRLSQGERTAQIGVAMAILGEARDPRGLSLLITLAQRGAPPGYQLIDALARYDTPRSWRAATEVAERHSRGSDEERFVYTRHLASRATRTAFAEPATASMLKTFIRAQLKNDAVAGWAVDARMQAARMVQEHRLPEFTPELVALLPDSTGPGTRAYAVLVNLYGRADAPAFRGPVPAEAVTWWRNLLVTNPPLVTRARGDEASGAWSRRTRR